MWTFLAACVQPLVGWWQQRSLDAPRKKRLRHLLKHPPAGNEWMTMETLSSSIGSDEAETSRLLLKIGARRSTGQRNVWRLDK